MSKCKRCFCPDCVQLEESQNRLNELQDICNKKVKKILDEIVEQIEEINIFLAE